MARERDDLVDRFDASDGDATNFFAEEEALDRAGMWRLGTWGIGSVAAVTLAIIASQSSSESRRVQIAAETVKLQSLQIQRLAEDSQSEARRLAAAIETLTSDRDRLFTRITTLEQGLDSVTGSITRQPAPPVNASADPASSLAAPLAAPADPAPSAPVALTAVPRAALTPAESTGFKPALEHAAATPAMPLMQSPSMMAPPDPAAAKLVEPAPAAEPAPPTVEAEPTASTNAAAAPIAMQRTEFGIDLGGASTVDGLRMLWQRLAKSDQSLSGLRPIIVVRERTSRAGMQLRLVAGPLRDAATAARLCAGLFAADRPCEPTVFDGQSLGAAGPTAPPRAARKRSPPPALPPKETSGAEEEAAPAPSALSTFLGAR